VPCRVLIQKTAKKLMINGFENIIFPPEKSAASLRDLIIKTHKDKSAPIFYFHGSNLTLDFKKELEKFGFKVEKILAYQIEEITEFSADFLAITKKISFDQVMIFSQNSGRIFFELVKKYNMLEYFKSSQILCLSDQIRLKMKNFGFSNCTIL
jgi:uroporphyrinogen-III synthase